MRRAVQESGALLRRYFETRNLIPPQNLVECTYESLVASPLAVLEEIHQRLRIPEFESVAAKLPGQGEAARYVRNVHPKLSAEEESLVWTTFQKLVERGLYAPEPGHLPSSGRDEPR